jgi:hypothetical protein
MGQTSRALRLAQASWDIVRQDRALLALPAMSAVAILGVLAVFFVPTGALAEATHSHSKTGVLIASALAVYPLTFIGIFFRFAFVVVVSGRLDGRQTSIADGLEIAWNRRASIAEWALIASLVAVLIRGLRQIPLLGGIVGSILCGMLGIVWGAVTFFVVPVIAIEGTTGRRAAERSASLFRERWGLEAVGIASISGLFALAVLVGAVFVVFAIAVLHGSAVAVVVLICASAVALVGASLALTAVQQTFGLVLYRYATGRPLPAGFSEADLEKAVRPKRRRGLFGG